jgi:hypothetical protein
LFQLRSESGPTNWFLILEGPFAPYKLSVPPKHGVGLEQQDKLIEPAARPLRTSFELDSKHSQNALVPHRDATWSRIRKLALQDAQLVAQQRYFEVFLLVGQSPRGKQVQE